MNIIFKNNISDKLKELVEKEQVRYEIKNNIVCNYKTFYIVAESNGETIGMVSGYTCYAEIYIDDIVVFEAYRHKRIGQNMIEKIEDHFKEDKFNNINLVTSEFQAPEFYKKCGFELEFTRVNKQNPFLTKYFFVKFL